MAKVAAVVLSAGRGSRMKSDIPKQYLPLKGKPVIYYCLKAFEESAVDEIVLVTGAQDVDFCKEQIVKRYAFQKVTHVVPGGKERSDSVFEGIKVLQGADYVLIHDGARPILTQEIIARSIDTVQKEKACVVGMPVKDTIKVIDDAGYASHTPERSSLWLVQTPQCFSLDLICEAYEKLHAVPKDAETSSNFTDDAMLVEQMTGAKVKLIEGSYQNIKITTPEDLSVAALFLEA